MLRHAFGSDVGQRRSGNEDSAYVSDRLLAVADGMGGHVAGEVASALAIAAIEALDARLTETGDAGVELAQALGATVTDASERLVARVAEDPDLREMGTTLTAMLWRGGDYVLAHVGDSRGYRLRDGELTQLTKDHTMVQTLLDSGNLTAEAAVYHPGRSVLVNALMAGAPGEPDLTLDTAEPGDRYLLCSDGLTDAVDVYDIRDVLASVAEPEDAVAKLIELANAGGGPDNITVVIGDYLADAPSADPDEQAGGTDDASDTNDTGKAGEAGEGTAQEA